jgi:hypothetical protein
VTIEGNRIDDSYIYAIFISNGDGISIVGNVTFIRGSALGAGQLYGINPDSAIFMVARGTWRLATMWRRGATKVAGRDRQDLWQKFRSRSE